MATSKTNNRQKEKWYEVTATKWIALISGFLLVAGMGYGFAIIQKNLEFKMEKYEMNLEFSKKLQEQIEKCREEKQIWENKRVDAIETVVSNLEKDLHGNKTK